MPLVEHDDVVEALTPDRADHPFDRSRTHLALDKDTPESGPVDAAAGRRIVAVPQVGGLHHRYERRAA